MQVVNVSSTKVVTALAIAIFVLVVASTFGQISTFYLGHDYLYGLVNLFSLNIEANIPTWYSSVTLLACSALLAVIATIRQRQSARWWRHWSGMSLVFLYLSIDEGSHIHELLNRPLGEHFGTEGVLYFAWVIPAILIVAVLAVTYLKFMISLQPATRRRFILAAVLFIGGAAGLEMVEANWVGHHGTHNVHYVILWTIEETLEMAGVLVFLSALLRYLRDEIGTFHVRFGSHPTNEMASKQPSRSSYSEV